VKFLTVIKKKVKMSAVEVKEGDGRMGQFENGAKSKKYVKDSGMMYENKKAGAA